MFFSVKVNAFSRSGDHRDAQVSFIICAVNVANKRDVGSEFAE
jgi:hypothetical protein